MTSGSKLTESVASGVEDQYASFLKSEPLVLAHILAGPIAGAVALFAPGDPSKPAEQITAGVIAVALVLQGFLVRRFVTPAWKKATNQPAAQEVQHHD